MPAIALVLALLGLIACGAEDPEFTPTNYHREALFLEYSDIYRDTIKFKEACLDSLTIIGCGYSDLMARETVWNCNKMDVTRSGDTILLRSSIYTPPDSIWVTQFQCLDSYDPFVLDAQGRGTYVGTQKFPSDPEVRVKDDTLFFKQTLTFFDRGYTSDRGPYAPTPRWIRYPQYGTLNNLDSLQSELKSYCTTHEACDLEEPFYRVIHHEWIYVAGEPDSL